MILPSKIRRGKLLALLAAFIAVLLLVLPHATDHHAAALFLLVPVLLFLEPVPASVPYQPRKHHVIAPNHHVRPTLFQRPPPAQA
jgi:predicted MFS family arabinose efflux permease